MTDSRYSMLGKLIEPELKGLIAEKNFKELREALSELDPADIAEAIEVLEEDEQVLLFRFLPRDTAADVFEYLPFHAQETLVQSLGNEQVAHLLNEMAPDDRTAFLEDLPGIVAKRFINLLDADERRVATELLGYPEGSIGRRTTTEYVEIRETMTVEEALNHIRETGEDKETISVVYVVDNRDKLIDDLRLRQLIFADPKSRIGDLMDRQFVALNAFDDQERAIEIMTRYDRVALPVIEKDGTLVGIVTADDIFDVAEEEATEDIHRLGGVEELEAPYLSISIPKLVRKRIGWLAILFVGGTFTARTLNLFEDFLARLPFLMVFIPLILSNGGNAGSQASTLVIRSMALQEVEAADWFRILLREILSGLLLGALLGAMAYGVLNVFPIDQPLEPAQLTRVMLAVSCSVFGAVMVGNLVGSMLPFLLRLAGIDPALASNPFVATLSDISGVIIYFSIAQLFLAGMAE